MSMYKAQNASTTSQRIAYSMPSSPTRFSAVTSNDINWQHTHASNFSQASPHGYGSLCNQLTHLTNIKTKKRFLCLYKVGLRSK